MKIFGMCCFAFGCEKEFPSEKISFRNCIEKFPSEIVLKLPNSVTSEFDEDFLHL